MSYCRVLVRSKSPALAGGLTYEVGDASVSTGTLVVVPLRRSTIEGIVVNIQEHRGDFDVKKIQRSLQDYPLLPAHCVHTASWIAEYYKCSVRQAIAPFLPAQRWSDLLPKTRTYIRLLDPEVVVRGKRREDIVSYLRDEEWVALDVVRHALGTPVSVIKQLEDTGVIALEQRHSSRSFMPRKFINPPSLTPEQSDALWDIENSTIPSLLFGVTGSGKTEVYAKAIADTVQDGKQAILLVPEILLTEHSILRFQTLLTPERIAIVHSRMTPSERKQVWRQCREGVIDLVIGSRSALFSPLEHLGLVVIDEEHEWTYKNEQTPRYHARETAEALCRFAGARLVLGTATPSLEAWSRAKEGKYTLARLSERYKKQSMPTVQVVDLATVQFGEHYPFSPELLSAIRDTIEAGEQCVLYLNRRGMATAMLCLECRRRIVSPDSLLPFTVHQRADGTQVLFDHTTNACASVPSVCPHCHSTKLFAVGAGTQKVEKILESEFPHARILRADSDTLTTPEDMKTLLTTMKNNEADILFGTQTVSKGLDLPNVTLAAVLLADIGLSLPHFRAGERIFQALTQLTGRSGRAKPGKVIIQTFRPDCIEVRYAASHETESFLEAELQLRRSLGYPPAVAMVRLLMRGPTAAQDAQGMAKKITALHMQCTVTAAPTAFGGGRTWHVFVRGPDSQMVIENIDTSQVVIDVDPLDCI